MKKYSGNKWCILSVGIHRSVFRSADDISNLPAPKQKKIMSMVLIADGREDFNCLLNVFLLMIM